MAIKTIKKWKGDRLIVSVVNDDVEPSKVNKTSKKDEPVEKNETENKVVKKVSKKRAKQEI